MRIVHICLACFYIEGWGYQENILPKYHAQEGHDVMILTSDYMFNSRSENAVKQERDYLNPHGVHVKVLDRANRYGWYSHYGDYSNICVELEAFRPDVIFVHGGQFIALKDVISYCRRNKDVKLYIDQHGDYYNTPVNTLRRKLASYWIHGYWIRKASKLAQKLWGVTPWRCQYLHEVYGVPEKKIGLLVMGGDDALIPFAQAQQIRTQIRQDLGIGEDDFVVVTGGKIDRAKNIHLLAQAVRELNRENLHLIIFGQPAADMEKAMEEMAADPRCHCVGWVDSSKVYDYFLASDLAAFPGTHSVLWEQVCACGIPALFKEWEGMRHVCVNGNSKLLSLDSVEEIKAHIARLLDDPSTYHEMKEAADQCKEMFFYSQIAKRAIGENYETDE